MKTIAIVTTGRCDYGLLFPLIKRLYISQNFTVKIIATGTHISKLHGNTIDKITEDGINVSKIIDLNINGNTKDDICQIIANCLRQFSLYFNENNFDFLIILGDRYELWPICIASIIYKIPIVHIHGGESTSGLIDDYVRHSITKMASFHFASTEIYKNRIIQMGENPKNVFNVGALGIDNIKSLKLLNIEELSEYTGVDFKNNQVCILTYHPVTMDNLNYISDQIKNILNSLLNYDILTIITMPNIDHGSEIIFDIMLKYCKNYPKKFIIIKNLGQKAYLSALKFSKFIIGNSSSGIIESSSFKIPVINIGDRQGGRLKPENIIDCGYSKKDITMSISKALSEEFKNKILDLKNPYGDGESAEKIAKILEKIDLSNKSKILKKGFNDLNFKIINN